MREHKLCDGTISYFYVAVQVNKVQHRRKFSAIDSSGRSLPKSEVNRIRKEALSFEAELLKKQAEHRVKCSAKSNAEALNLSITKTKPPTYRTKIAGCILRCYCENGRASLGPYVSVRIGRKELRASCCNGYEDLLIQTEDLIRKSCRREDRILVSRKPRTNIETFFEDHVHLNFRYNQETDSGSACLALILGGGPRFKVWPCRTFNELVMVAQELFEYAQCVYGVQLKMLSADRMITKGKFDMCLSDWVEGRKLKLQM